MDEGSSNFKFLGEKPAKMKINTNTGITWTELELSGLLEDEDSHVFYEKFRKHLGLHPFHLTDLNTALKEILTSKLNFYDQELKGFVIAYRSPKLASPLGDILYDSCFIHVDVEAEFYVFRPEVGCMLKGIVNKKGSDHIGILVHKAFNVSIPKPETKNGDWIGENLQIGQEVRFSITYMDFKSRLPFFRGVLDAETYLEGCQIFNTTSNDIDDLYDIPSNQLQQNNSKHIIFDEENAEEETEVAEEKPKKIRKKSRRKESIKQEEQEEEENVSEESTKGRTKSRKKSKSNSEDTERIKQEHSDKFSNNDVEVTYSSNSDAEKSLKKKIKKVKVDPDLEVTWNDYGDQEKSNDEGEYKTSKRQKSPKKIKPDPDASHEISEKETVETINVTSRISSNENCNNSSVIKTEMQSWKKNKSFLLDDSDSNSSDDIPTKKPENSLADAGKDRSSEKKQKSSNSIPTVFIKKEKDSSPQKGKRKLFVDDENSETVGIVQNGEMNSGTHENENEIRQSEESERDKLFGRRKNSHSFTESPQKKENLKKKKVNNESEENVVNKKRKRLSSVTEKSESAKSSDNLDSDSNLENKGQNVIRKREKVSPGEVASPRKGLKKVKKEKDVEEESHSHNSNKRKRKNSSSISTSDKNEAVEEKGNYSSADEFESKESIRRKIEKLEVDLNFKSPENSPKKKKSRKVSESSDKISNEKESENRKGSRLSSSESDNSPSNNRKSKKGSRSFSPSATGGYEESKIDASDNKIEKARNRAEYSSSDEDDFSSLLRNIKKEARQVPICISPRGSPKKVEIKDEPI